MEMNGYEQVGERLGALESALAQVLALLRAVEAGQQQVLTAVQGNGEVLADTVTEHGRKMTVMWGG